MASMIETAGKAFADRVRSLGLKSPRAMSRPARKAFWAMLARRWFEAQTWRARRRRLKSSSLYIGITGSSAKTTTTALLGHILKAHGNVTDQVGKNMLPALVNTLISHPRDTEFVVAELAIAQAGEMRPMAETLRPDIAIVTLIDLEHYSAFRKREVVASEKGHLVEMVRPGGIAVLNADDPHAMGMAARTTARIVTFGRLQDAHYRATAIEAAFPDRLKLTVQWSGGKIDLQSNFIGEHFWVSAVAAFATAIEVGMPPEAIARQVASFEPIANRCGILTVPDGPQFIVDTIKAPWHSLPLAFEAIAKAKAVRKRIVLGQMSDFAGSSSKYAVAYKAARAASDHVTFVGENSHRSKASQEDRDQGRFTAFSTPLEVAEHIRNTAVPGELILLKGSNNLHMERIAMSFVEEVNCWVPSCGMMIGCKACGLYATPYEFHRGRKDWQEHNERKRRHRRLLTPWKTTS